MLDYVVEALIRLQHNASKKTQDQPHLHIKSIYVEKVKYYKEEDSSPLLG